MPDFDSEDEVFTDTPYQRPAIPDSAEWVAMPAADRLALSLQLLVDALDHSNPASRRLTPRTQHALNIARYALEGWT